MQCDELVQASSISTSKNKNPATNHQRNQNLIHNFFKNWWMDEGFVPRLSNFNAKFDNLWWWNFELGFEEWEKLREKVRENSEFLRGKWNYESVLLRFGVKVFKYGLGLELKWGLECGL